MPRVKPNKRVQQRGGSTNGEHAGTGGDGGGGGGRPGIVRRLATCFFYLFVAVLVLDFMAISYLDGVDEYFMIWKDAWDTAEDAPRMMTGVYLPTYSEIEELLQPLESRCFTYLPTTWREGNVTLRTPFMFQWCHKGRATIHAKDGRTRQQLDFGTNGQTVIAFEPIEPGRKPREIMFPAVVQRFVGTGGCRLAVQEDDRGAERSEQLASRNTLEVAVHLWCCGPLGGGLGELGGAQIVNLVKVGTGGGRAKDGGDGTEDGEAPGGGENACDSFVASVCTHLLCPAYRDYLNRRKKIRHPVPVASGNFEMPPPPVVVSRYQRGFSNYDRRQVMSPGIRLELREQIREMFTHSYDGYMKHAYPGGELLPLSCRSGELDLVKMPMVTLVDTLDSLAIMGNASEFRRAVRLVSEGLDVTADVDVSVFESNIRLLGGLLSAHMLAMDPDLALYPCPGRCCPRTSVHGAAGIGGDECDFPKDEVFSGGRGGRGVNGRGGDGKAPGRSCGAGDGGRKFSGTSGSIDNKRSARRRASLAAGASEWGDSATEARARAAGDGMAGMKGRGEGSGFADGWAERGEDGGECEEYDGELLVLAERLGRRLLPAFETPTGIPFGTVNLKTGVPEGETTISSLAGAGSLTVEFSVLSALTGDGVFAEAAERAVKALFSRRTPVLGLLGKHIDSKNGAWTEAESGIGTNGDSFYEYLLKMYVLWGDVEYWDMFIQAYTSVQRFVREGDWYTGVDIWNGMVTIRRFDNLMAFWPGMQTLIGDVSLATRTLNALYMIWRDWGFLPEQFEHESWELRTGGVGRAYPLRPELIESTLLVYKATGDPSWLWAGRDFLESLQRFCKTECGYAGIRDVQDCSLDEQMPSFFLSETLKYLYLLFDEDNFLHKGNYVFSTEAHPFSIDAVRRGGRFRDHETRHPSSALNSITSSSSSRPPAPADNSAPNDYHQGSTLAPRVSSTQEPTKLGSGGRGGGAWAALRASAGEGHHLGPSGWRDASILFWVEGGGGLEEEWDAGVAVHTELRYMRTLWKMYTERICPVLPWWLAPYRYSPATFRDTFSGGGRSIWVSVSERGARTVAGGSHDDEYEEVHRGVFLDDVGLIEISVSGNDFSLYHPDSGETLQISHADGLGGGAGIPGGPDAGGMLVVSYFGEKRKNDRRSSGDNGASKPGAGAGRRGKEGGKGGKNKAGRGDWEEPAAEEGAEECSWSGNERAEVCHEEGDREGTGRKRAKRRGRRAPQKEARSVGDASHRDQASVPPFPPAQHDPGSAPLSSLRTVLVTNEGLTIYCSLTLLKNYPCSVATFSPAGSGLVIIPPVYAPLHLLESTGTPSDSFGCHLPFDLNGNRDDGSSKRAHAAPEDTARASWGEHLASSTRNNKGHSRASASPGISMEDFDNIRLRQGRPVKAKGSRRAETTALPEGGERVGLGDDGGRGKRSSDGSGGRLYSGKILVVSRGQCTFEHKAMVAEAAGAVGLVVLNNEPGGHVFAMTGHAESEGELSGVTIPVIMVGMEDGIELRRALTAMDAAGGSPVQGVLDVRTLHQKVISRLVQEQREGLRDSRGALINGPHKAGRHHASHIRSGSSRPHRRSRTQGSADVSMDRFTEGSVPLATEETIWDHSSAWSSSTADVKVSTSTSQGADGWETSTTTTTTTTTTIFTSTTTTISSGATTTKSTTSATGTVNDYASGGSGGLSITVHDHATGNDHTRDISDDVGSKDLKGSPGARATGEEGEVDDGGDFPFLLSGYDDTTLGGMRPPPYFLPKVAVGEDHVQVMGVGHWGAGIFAHEGAWALTLMHNSFNPPPRPRTWSQAKVPAGSGNGGGGDVGQEDDDDDDDL